MLEIGRAIRSIKNVFSRKKENQISFSELFKRFQNILHQNNAGMEIIADLDGKLGGDYVFDRQYLIDSVKKLKGFVLSSAYDLNFITKNQFLPIYEIIENLANELEIELSGKMVIHEAKPVYFLNEIEEGMEDIVGYKAYNLSKLIDLPKINLAPGFVATIGCFRDYLAYNNLFEKIAPLIEAFAKEEKSVESVSSAICLMILGGEVPPGIRKDIHHAAEQICEKKSEITYFSVRSSAVGEDGDLSFAGLHDSFLNVRFNELLSMFKKVLASLYNTESLTYRLKMNLFPMEMAMPVLYQTMIPSQVAGVLYTLDPSNPDTSESILSASWGLGKVVVEGQGAVDTFRIARNPPNVVAEQKINSKRWMIVPFERGPVRKVSKELQDKPCLTPQQASQITETGLMLERFFKRPLDVEWSLDKEKRVWVLQARPLKIVRPEPNAQPEHFEMMKEHPILINEKGMIAYRGIGAGPVYIVESGDDLNRFPAEAVLVSRYAMPWLAKIIPLARAIITDVGTTTGHMATVAREFRVPTIVGTGVATSLLTNNQLITVDAERNIVYEGRFEELLKHQLLQKPVFETTKEYQVLHRLIKKISPLSLTDPNAPNFTPKGCRSFHDVMHFAHEKSFQTLTQIGKDPRAFIRRGGKRLKSHIPLDLVLIDLGGGISKEVGQEKYIDADQITSVPMRAIWDGLSSPDTWSMEPIPVDFKGLMSSLTRTRSTEVLGNNFPGVNLGVIGNDYVSLSLPLGYHFTTVEAVVGPQTENNYIAFRFFGGVTDITRRCRRATLLMNILERVDFKVNVSGDLVIARAIDLTEDKIKKNLNLIGRLIGFTRQLDVLLKNDADVAKYMEKFMDHARGANETCI